MLSVHPSVCSSAQLLSVGLQLLLAVHIILFFLSPNNFSRTYIIFDEIVKPSSKRSQQQQLQHNHKYVTELNKTNVDSIDLCSSFLCVILTLFNQSLLGVVP